MVHAFQGAAADGGFGKAPEASMKRGQTLVQPYVARRLRQSAQQRHQRLVGQIVRKKQVGISNRGAHCDRDFVGIRLIEDRHRRFELLDDHRPFLGSDRAAGDAPSMRATTC